MAAGPQADEDGRAAPRASSRAARTPTAASRSCRAASSNAQSTAWAIQGLLAAGRDPAKVRARSRDPLAYLRSLTSASGEVRYSRTSRQTPVWVTAQAVMALARKPLPLKPVARARRAAAAPAPPAPRPRPRRRDRRAEPLRRTPRSAPAPPAKAPGATAAPAAARRCRPRCRRGGGPRRRGAPAPIAGYVAGLAAFASCEELRVATDAPSRIGFPARESRSPQGDGPRRAPRGALARRGAPLGRSGHEVIVEAGAGEAAGVPDEQFTEAGRDAGRPLGRRRGRQGRGRRARPRPAASTASRS